MADSSIEAVAISIAKGVSPKSLKESGWTASEKESNFEIDSLVASSDKAQAILALLFPEGLPIGHEFYNRLARFSRYYGFGEPSEKLIGILWVAAFETMSENNRSTLFDYLQDSENMDYWAMVRSLPQFLPFANLPLENLPNFLTALGKKIGADMAGGPFFRAVELFGFHRPNEATQVLNKYLTADLDDIAVHLSSIILGAIRAAAREKRFDPSTVLQIDHELSKSLFVPKRLLFHRSWSTSYTLGNVTLDELDQRLNQMLEGCEEEIGEAFGVAYRCILGKLDDEIFASYYRTWIEANSRSNIPDNAKYWVVNSIWRLCSKREGKHRILAAREGAIVLARIQPIPFEHAGTWRDLEYFLVDTLKENQKNFAEAFSMIYLANQDGVLGLLAADRFQYLESTMNEYSVGTYVLELIASPTAALRKLGFGLLQTHRIKLDAEMVAGIIKPTNDVLNTVLLESVRRPMLGDETSQFFLALLPVYESSETEMRSEFAREMVLQAVNYPGACLECWKKVENPSDLLKQIVNSAEEYFARLRSLALSPAMSFSFPEFGRAAERGAIARSRQISESVNEKSILRRLATTIQVIYGNTWTTYTDGKLGRPSGFQEISHSIEYPRLEQIDPEGMAIRRLQAAAELQKLEKDVHN